MGEKLERPAPMGRPSGSASLAGDGPEDTAAPRTPQGKLALLEALVYEPEGIRLLPLTGRLAWALMQLAQAGSYGVTAIENPAPRLAAYVHKLRGLGIHIGTLHEAHGGPFSGRHSGVHPALRGDAQAAGGGRLMGGPVLSNEMADMAESAGTAWRASTAAAQESVEHAIEAGYLLVTARNRAGYGEWRPFLARAGIPERQAQRLMQLARSFVQPDTVSALGGIKATLAALGKFRLPEPGQMVLVDNLSHPHAFGLIWPSAEHDGCFNLAGLTEDGSHEIRFMSKPIAGPFVFTVLWLVVPPADDVPAFLTAPEDGDLSRLLDNLMAGDSEPLRPEVGS